MPPSITWADVKVDFAELEKARVHPQLVETLDRIQSLIGSRQGSPDFVKSLITVVSGMSAQFGKLVQEMGGGGKEQALRTVMQQADIKFAQEKWDVGIANNAQTIIQFIMEPVRNQVEEPKPSISLPVVLLVMNQKEAKELDIGKIAVEMPKNYLDEFKKLKDLLKPDWLKRYGKTPEEWKPFDAAGSSIKDLMTDTFEEVRLKLGYQKLVVPDFVDIRTLSADRKRVNRLRQNGCFVINDVISLWHPAVQVGYRASLLEAFPKTIVYRIVPIDQKAIGSQPLIAYVEKYEDLEFFQRIKDRDLHCRNISDSVDFTTFVDNYAPGLIPDEEKETSVVARNIVGGKSR